MELPRIFHDELLHKLDEPQEQHMAEVLHAAEVEVPVKDLDAKTQQRLRRDPKTEHTPLLKASPSGAHVVVVDVDKVEEILNAEEKDAVAEDAKLPTWTIVNEESLVLVKLSVPMVRTQSSLLPCRRTSALPLLCSAASTNTVTHRLSLFGGAVDHGGAARVHPRHSAHDDGRTRESEPEHADPRGV